MLLHQDSLEEQEPQIRSHLANSMQLKEKVQIWEQDQMRLLIDHKISFHNPSYNTWDVNKKDQPKDQ